MVEPGEYFENIVLRRVNNVTIKSQAGPVQTIINGGENDIVIDSDASNRAGGITIDGFTVTGFWCFLVKLCIIENGDRCLSYP